MEAYPAVIARENQHYLPFLATTTILMEAVKAGAGREAAHQAVQDHAVATVRDLRTGRIEHNNLLDRLANDPRIPLTRPTLDHILQQADQLAGAATTQVDAFLADVDTWAAKYPEALDVTPGPLL
jgi:adenylosuccinate lyase